MKLCSFDFKSIAQLQIDQNCVGCDKKWKQSYEHWKSDEKEVFIYPTTILWIHQSTDFFVYHWSHTFNFFSPLFCLWVPCQWKGIFFFFLLVFIAPVWVSYQSCSFAFSTDKDEKCLPLSFSYKMPTASLNHASVLLGLFSPLTHFNTYQLQGLVLPKLLRMKTKIPLS